MVFKGLGDGELMHSRFSKQVWYSYFQLGTFLRPISIVENWVSHETVLANIEQIKE